MKKSGKKGIKSLPLPAMRSGTPSPMIKLRKNTLAVKPIMRAIHLIVFIALFFLKISPSVFYM